MNRIRKENISQKDQSQKIFRKNALEDISQIKPQSVM